MVGQIDLCKFTFPATGALSSPPHTQVCKLCIGVTVVQVGLSVMYYRELQQEWLCSSESLLAADELFSVETVCVVGCLAADHAV